MKSILKKLHWNSIIQQLACTTQRFPLSSVSAMALTVLWVLSVGNAFELDADVVGRLSLALLFLFLLSLLSEQIWGSLLSKKISRNLVNVLVILLTLGYWALLPANFSSVSVDFGITQAMILLSLFVSVWAALSAVDWWLGKYSNDSFYYLMVTVFVVLLEALLVGVVVGLLGSALLGTIDVLFDPSFIDGELYMQCWVVSSVLIAPLFGLSRWPKQAPQSLVGGDTFLSGLISYVAIPFICVYFVVLYAYTVKVLINFSQWPQGEVAWLVIWFASFSYLVFVLSYFAQDVSWVSRVRQMIPLLLLPQIGMLFYSIALRINQYGWTVNRYLVVAFGVWLLILSLYFIWKKKQSQLIIIPASLLVFMLGSVVGPLSMFAVSQRSQTAILEQWWPQRDSAQGEKRVRSAVQYLCNYHGCDVLQRIPGVQDNLDKVMGNSWEAIQALDLNQHKESAVRYYSYRSDWNHFDVEGYRVVHDLQQKNDETQVERILFSYKKNALVVARQGQEVVVPIQDQLEKLTESAGDNNVLQDYSIDILDGQFRVMIKDFTMHGDQIEYINAFVLEK